VQAVLGLLPGEAAGDVEHIGGDLLSDVGGQAVQRHGVGIGEREELRVTLSLELVSEVEQRLELVSRPGGDAGEASALQALGTPGIEPSYKL